MRAKKKRQMEQDVLCRRRRRNSAYTFNFLIKKKSVFLQFFQIFLCWRAKHKEKTKKNSGQEICVCRGMGTIEWEKKHKARPLLCSTLMLFE